MFGDVFDPTLEEIRWFGREDVGELILELRVVVEGNSVQIVGRESRTGCNPMGQGSESRADVEESPSRVPEWLLSSYFQCVIRRCHAEESLHVVDPGVFA
jgi:hypothetical protein